MENKVRVIGYRVKSFAEHSCYHAQYRSIRDGIADQIATVQIQNGRKIQFLTKQVEFSYICYPFLVRFFGGEISVQQIWSYLAYFALVRAIFLHSDAAN